jgi:hypothetical protein
MSEFVYLFRIGDETRLLENPKGSDLEEPWRPGTIRRAMSCFATHGIRLLSRPSMIC